MSAKIIISNLDDLLARYVAGESENKLAKEAGISRSTFRNRLLENGINPRGQSESESIKWSRMSNDQRIKQVSAAHAATRGRKVSFEELCLRAKMREGNMFYNVSKDEIKLGGWLMDMNIPVVHNFAVGPYNCDIGTGSITVEVWGGGWHPKPIEIKRTKYILDAGFSVLIIDVDKSRFPISQIVTEYVVTLDKLTRSNPTDRRQYWMIRGDGELIFKRFNSDDISLKPPFTTGRNSLGQYIRVPN